MTAQEKVSLDFHSLFGRRRRGMGARGKVGLAGLVALLGGGGAAAATAARSDLGVDDLQRMATGQGPTSHTLPIPDALGGPISFGGTGPFGMPGKPIQEQSPSEVELSENPYLTKTQAAQHPYYLVHKLLDAEQGKGMWGKSSAALAMMGQPSYGALRFQPVVIKTSSPDGKTKMVPTRVLRSLLPELHPITSTKASAQVLLGLREKQSRGFTDTLRQLVGRPRPPSALRRALTLGGAGALGLGTLGAGGAAGLTYLQQTGQLPESFQGNALGDGIRDLSEVVTNFKYKHAPGTMPNAYGNLDAATDSNRDLASRSTLVGQGARIGSQGASDIDGGTGARRSALSRQPDLISAGGNSVRSAETENQFNREIGQDASAAAQFNGELAPYEAENIRRDMLQTRRDLNSRAPVRVREGDLPPGGYNPVTGESVPPVHFPTWSPSQKSLADGNYWDALTHAFDTGY